MRQLRIACVVVALLCWSQTAWGQTYGVELHNSLMPASGGMGGASFTQPQDVQSALNGNPATMTLFEGTQFAFGAGWAEPTINIFQDRRLPAVGVLPYQAKSSAPGSALANIGIIHATNFRGRPVHIGLGFLGNAGLASDYRHEPNSNGTHSALMALDVNASAAMQLSPRLSVGSSVQIGTGIMDGPFVQSSSSQTDYALRGSLGLNYLVNETTTMGVYYQTKKSHSFANAFRGPLGDYQTVELDLPDNIGFGVANNGLMCGRLLLAADLLFKNYSAADLFGGLYNDQWVVQLGSQYIVNPRMRLRMGYAFNENPMRDQVPGTIGGVVPVGGIPAVNYVQAQFAAICQHRLTAGVGVSDVMPGVDLDLSVGGMFENSDTFGSTLASLEGYWAAFGLTWRTGCCPTTGYQPPVYETAPSY